METKFVKAYCQKTKQYFALEVKKYGATWKVTNFTHLSPEEAKVTASEIEQDSFETNANLLPCLSCKTRKVGSCSCARHKNQCAQGMKYQFNCIYCDQLKIDYSLPEMDSSRRAGEKVTLSQGQEVVIRFADNRPLTNILVGVGWDPVSQGDNMDVDSSVVVMSPNGREYELVYYSRPNMKHPSGCAELLEDNLTGEYTGNVDSNDDENILVDLKKVPQDRDKLIFLVNIFNCEDRAQTLKDVKNFYIRLCDQSSKKALIEYKVENQQINPHDTAIVIGVATRKASGWAFKAIGTSLKVSDVQQLARKCVDYI